MWAAAQGPAGPEPYPDAAEARGSGLIPGRSSGSQLDAGPIRVIALALAVGCGLTLGMVPVVAGAALRTGPELAAVAIAGLLGVAAVTGWLARVVADGLAERVADEVRSAAVVAALRRPPAAQQRLRLLLPASLPGLASAAGRGAIATPLTAAAVVGATTALVSLAALALDTLLVGAGAFAAALAAAVAAGDPPTEATAETDQDLAAILSAAMAPSHATPGDPRLARATGPALRRRRGAGLAAATASAQPLVIFGLVGAVAGGLLPVMLGTAATSDVVLPALGEVAVVVAAGYVVYRANLLRRAAASANLTLAFVIRGDAGDPNLPFADQPLNPVGRATLQLAGGVSLRRVTVRLDAGPPVLADVDLDVAPGERVGVLVPRGPAAATLAALLAGLLDPDDGAVLLDGADTRALAPSAVWSQVALVPQEPALVPGTLLDNLAASETADDRVRGRVAAEMIGLDRIMSLGDPVAGHWWSPGELRRLAVARALAADPAIVVMQDPAAGIDAPSERLVRAAVDDLAAGRTSVILSEHPPALQGCDLLVVLGRDGTARPVTWAELTGEQQAG